MCFFLLELKFQTALSLETKVPIGLVPLETRFKIVNQLVPVVLGRTFQIALVNYNQGYR